MQAEFKRGNKRSNEAKGNRSYEVETFPLERFADPVKLEAHGPFDWNKYSPFIVEDSGGGVFRVQDRMTRWENALRAGIKKLPAYVFPQSGG